MTTAPPTLTAVRRLLLAHLDMHPNSAGYPADLDPAEVGIVGNASHKGGYHCGRDRVTADDYSVRESARDRAGLSEYASAIDIGQFSVTVRGRTHDLRSFSKWLVAECAKGAPDTRDIREVIYSPDGKTVKRWDRLSKRSSGDNSHLWHTHISYFRDATKSGRDLTGVYTRYLIYIGLMEDDVSARDVWANDPNDPNDPAAIRNAPHRHDYQTNPTVRPAFALSDMWAIVGRLQTSVTALQTAVAALRADVADLRGREPVDPDTVVRGVLAGLTPEAIAAAIPADLADRVVDALSVRLAARDERPA